MTKRSAKILIVTLLTLVAISIAIATASFSVAAVEGNDLKVKSFSVTATSTAKTEYQEGDTFDPTGYEGTITYSDGTTATVSSSDLSFSPTGVLKPSDRLITFSCAQTQITSGLPITVYALESISVKTPPTKDKYYAGELFDPDGLKLQLNFADNTSKEVKFSDCSISPDILTPLTHQNTSVTVSYDIAGHTVKTDIPIAVVAVDKITVTGTPAASFYEGGYFSSSEGLKVSVTYADNTVNDSFTEFEIPDATKPLIPDAEGFATLTVTADGKSTQFKISIVPVESFNVTVADDKINVYPGDKFDLNSITVKAVYADNSTRDVTDDVTYTYSDIDIVTANTEIKAEYNGRDIPLPLIMHSGVVEIISAPDKVSYSVGETFDPTGLLVAIIYDDSTRKTLSATDYTIDVNSPLTPADSYAVVRYAGLEAKVSISVASDNPVQRIEIYHAPDHVKYVAGQTFSTEGLIIVAYYANSDQPQILPLESLIFAPSLETALTAADTSVQITYQISESEKYTVEQPIEVEGKIPSQIFVTQEATKKNYKEGEIFDPAGLEICLYYNDGTTVPLTSGFTISHTEPFVLNSNQSETVTILIEYTPAKLQCYQFVTVTPVPVKDISVALQPDKMSYFVGEKFDPAGMKLVLTYEDPSIAPVIVPDGAYTVSPSGALTATDTYVQISFRGLTANLNINLSGGIIPPVTTESTQPTTDNTTNVPPITNTPPVTTTPSDISSPTNPAVTTSPAPHTAPVTSGGGGINPMLILWIVIIAVIMIALVALIIFYKRNFT